MKIKVVSITIVGVTVTLHELTNPSLGFWRQPEAKDRDKGLSLFPQFGSTLKNHGGFTVQLAFYYVTVSLPIPSCIVNFLLGISAKSTHP